MSEAACSKESERCLYCALSVSSLNHGWGKERRDSKMGRGGSCAYLPSLH